MPSHFGAEAFSSCESSRKIFYTNRIVSEQVSNQVHEFASSIQIMNANSQKNVNAVQDISTITKK